MVLIVRQGDIILKEITNNNKIFLKTNEDEIENKNKYRDAIANVRKDISNTTQTELKVVKSDIVAYGEATGHQHKFVSGQVSLFRTEGQIIPKIVEIESEFATLSHQQHLPVHIPKGTYEVIKEISYDPFAKQVKLIED